MKYLITLLFLLLVVLHCTQVNAQQRYTISGTIRNSESHETLIGCSVGDKKSGKGTSTNEYGFYSLTLPKGEVELEAGYVGYAQFDQSFVLSRDTVINILMAEAAHIEAFTVTAQRKYQGVMSAQMGAVEIPITQIQSTPMMFGEKDIIKVIQLLPGVQSGSEGSAGMYVRGGGQDENLLLLDGVPVYNVNHMFGFFSVFNTDAVKNVTLFKGSFPARFSSRLSSVIDIRTNDGDMYSYHGNVSIGAISSKINFEGPIVKGKTSFNISARRTYADALIAPAVAYLAKRDSDAKTTAGYYFYDLNLKVNHTFSERDRLFGTFYCGDDRVYARYRTKSSNTDATEGSTKSEEFMKLRWGWGNMIGSLRWNHIWGPKLFMDSSVTFTRYRHNLTAGSENTTTTNNQTGSNEASVTAKSGIYDWTAKVDMEWLPTPSHSVRGGVSAVSHLFRPDVTTLHSSSTGEKDTNISMGNNKIAATELSAYAEDTFSPARWVSINAGVHYSAFIVQGEFYNSLQPRLSGRLLITDNLSFKAGYARMSQYIHLLSNNSISLPTDLWVPVTKRIKPMSSSQYSAGLFYNLLNQFDLSVEAYWKRMNNVLEYKDGASLMATSTGWEEKVVMGEGKSYGVEFLVQRSIGKTTGWIGYTWSKSTRQFNREGQMLNNGNVFPAKYDRRHDVSITVAHRFNDRIDVGATWVYNTGSCATLAMQRTTSEGIDDDFAHGTVSTPDYVSSRNNFRMEPYHRLDLGVNFNKKKKYGIRTWSISIYNAYNRMNAFMVYPSYSDSSQPTFDSSTSASTGQYRLTKLTIFPIIPSVSYSYKF